MAVSLSQLHKIMQIYGKQMNLGDRFRRNARMGAGRRGVEGRQAVENKRAMVIERVSAAVVDRIAEGGFEPESTEGQVLQILSLEYGRPLRVTRDALTDIFIFHIIDRNGKITQTLDEEESGYLFRKMVGLTRDIIDRTML